MNQRQAKRLALYIMARNCDEEIAVGSPYNYGDDETAEKIAKAFQQLELEFYRRAGNILEELGWNEELREQGSNV